MSQPPTPPPFEPQPIWNPQSGQPGQPPLPGPPGYGYRVPPPNSSRATTALVLGILGLVACPLVLSIPAIVLGHRATNEIDASQGQLGGRGLASTGFWLGVAGTALGAIGLLIGAALVIFGLFLTSTIQNCSTVGANDGTFTTDCSAN
ncbi:MAG: hypothetical protein JWR35_559 [Marmoricola sp.]|nr:hypothetical protein [Marmoricola sp.]